MPVRPCRGVGADQYNWNVPLLMYGGAPAAILAYLSKAPIELVLLPAVRRHRAGPNARQGILRSVWWLGAELYCALAPLLPISARVVPALPELKTAVQAVPWLGKGHCSMAGRLCEEPHRHEDTEDHLRPDFFSPRRRVPARACGDLEIAQ